MSAYCVRQSFIGPITGRLQPATENETLRQSDLLQADCYFFYYNERFLYRIVFYTSFLLQSYMLQLALVVDLLTLASTLTL